MLGMSYRRLQNGSDAVALEACAGLALACAYSSSDEYEAELVVISDSDDALSLAQAPLRLPSELPEWLTPITSVVPAQLFSYHLTRSKGHDPENPRTLRKVTLTQ